MEQVLLDNLLAATGGEAVGFGDDRTIFPRIRIDSRVVRPGDLFWALRGRRLDGHRFAEDSLRRGAAGCLVERSRWSGRTAVPAIVVENSLTALWDFARWHRRRQDATVIGVTGSFGKTTTREMIRVVLEQQFRGTASPKNFNNHFGVPLSVLGIDNQHEFAVLELAASRPGEIRDLAEMAGPNIGAVTGIGPAHWQGFGSHDSIIETKAALIDALPASGLAILSGDDPAVRSMARRAGCSVKWVGKQTRNDIRAVDVQARGGRLSFRVGKTDYTLPVSGRHHLTSALIAIAVAEEFGLETRQIVNGLKAFEPLPGRCRIEQIGPWKVIDDTYNAGPDSVAAACRLLRDLRQERHPSDGKTILVLGDMLELGEMADQFHREAGRRAAKMGIDQLLAYGDCSRHVTDGAQAGGMDVDCLAAGTDFRRLLGVLDDRLRPGDIVLVKGSRAMRMERVVDWLRSQDERQNNETSCENKTSRVPSRACV